MRVRSPNVIPHSPDSITNRLMNIKDPALLHQERVNYQKRKYEELLQKISFLDSHLRQEERKYDYPDDFRPFVFFFKFLARRPDVDNSTSNLNRLKLWLPDTILTSDGDNPPMWLYTSQDGYVHRTDNFSAKNITNKLGSFASPDELVAVLKKPQVKDFAWVGNDIRLLTMKDLSVISQSIVSSKGDVICLQKFVKSIGPKAFICRTCWRKGKNTSVWVITNNKDFFSEEENLTENQRYITNPRAMNSCTIVNSIRGRYVEETTPYVANLVRYIEHNIPGVRFEEFIADFVKDESGTWWLVNVRGFHLVDKLNINPKMFLASPDELDLPIQNAKKKKPHTYQKVTLCKYCEQLYPVEELLHKMTLKSIIQTDRHLMHRGKTFKWLKRSEIMQMDTAALLQEHKVCKSCYKLHQETERLRQIEFELAQSLGIPVNPEKRPDLVSVTGFSSSDPASNIALMNQALNIQTASSPTHHNNTEGEKEKEKTGFISNLSGVMSETPHSPTKNNNTNYIKRYRMMLYLHMLYDIPKDIDATKNYYIEYSIFNQKQRYKIDLTSAFSINGDILIPINKLRIFFLFSQDRRNINEFINEQKVIALNLFCDNEKIGTANFELNDFLSDKVIKREMFKVFSGKKLPILSWGLKVTMGLIEGGNEDFNRIRLSEHKNIYLTSPDYYTCEALPEEWIQTFEETQNHFTNLLGRSELRSSRYSINASRSDSFRRLPPKSSFKRNSIKGLNSSKEIKYKPDMIETSQEHRHSLSPTKSLFNDEKSISQVQTEKDNHDDSLEIVRKILVESIQDFEKGDRKVAKKSARKDAAPNNTNLTIKPSTRAMSAALKPSKAKSPDRVWSAIALKPISEN